MDVFVYGTLTDPVRVREVFEDTGSTGDDDSSGVPGGWRFVGDATLAGLRRVDGRYPTLVPGGTTTGRLLRLDPGGEGTGGGSSGAVDRRLQALDASEGVDRGLYVRVPVPRSSGTAPDDGEATGSVWVYVGDPDRLDVAGDFEWPGTGEFEGRVWSYVAGNDVRVETE